MSKPQQFDRRQIARLVTEGFTAQEIAQELGAKSPTHMKVLIRKIKKNMPDIQPGVPTKARKPLDVGKVKALARNNWSVVQIYYEFGMMYPIEEIREAMK